MDFFFFILLNTVLFIRPSEIVPGLMGLPIYEMCIVACIALSLPRIVQQLSWHSLCSNPISLCVVGLLFAVVAADLFGRFYVTGAVVAAIEFSKLLIYYFLLFVTMRTSRRLEDFVGWLCLLLAVVGMLTLLQYHGVFQLPGMEAIEQRVWDAESGSVVVVSRVQATGIFHDPNDLAMIMVFGLALAVYACGLVRWRPMLPLFMCSIGLFLYIIALTRSRGGLIALAIASFTFCQSRFGWKRAVPLGIVGLPLLLVLFGGRQADFSTAMSEGTGQGRIQIWSEGFLLLKSNFLFGIGNDQYAEKLHYVAHNSFVHAFTETGFIGGTFFLGAFLYPIWAMHRLGDRRSTKILQPEMARLRPYLLAAIAGYAGSMLSLTRNYIVPTYLVLGLATVYLRLVTTSQPLPELRLDGRLVRRAVFASSGFLFMTYAFVRLFGRFAV